MTFPIATVVRPADLTGQTNGRLSAALLRPVNPNTAWVMHHLAARAWEALRHNAWRAGVRLSVSGNPYRSYEQQVNLFRQRYTSVYDPGLNTLEDKRVWNGVTYYKRLGVAAVAVPGTSNHGWGLAVDTAIDADGDLAFEWPTNSLNQAAINWLLANASKFGFSWELQSEPWHIRYVTGDKIPQAVLDYEKGTTTPPPAPDVPRATIRLGSTGAEVTKLQNQCKFWGWYPHNVDGSCGPMTVEAIKKLQAACKTTVDGVYGSVTQTAYTNWLIAMSKL